MWSTRVLSAAALLGQLASCWDGFDFLRGLKDQFPLSTGPSSHEKAGSTASKRPNIIFVLTDDQDLHMQSLDYLPFIQKHLIQGGTLYKRHFCTTAICCPARVTIWTGKVAHNTNVTDVNPPYGGYPKFVSQGFNENYLPLWLQSAGYNTYYTGKLFNAHTQWNYHSPHVAGWTGSDFLLDPYTYSYLNSTYQRNHDEPVSHEGEHTVDVLAGKAYGFLDDAVKAGQPFFLGVAPVAPHSNINHFTYVGRPDKPNSPIDLPPGAVSAPIPAERHKHLFEDVKIPRTENFNPDEPSGAAWVRTLPQQSPENVEYNDDFYRNRLRALQGVDELVDGLVTRLEDYGILDNTYIIYTTDNGYHIGQHRLQPGKECSFEEDINVPLIIRGPDVPQGLVTEIVTAHADLAPTVLSLAGIPFPRAAEFDGAAIPTTKGGIAEAAISRHEHVNVEFWGLGITEVTEVFPGFQRFYANNTYKALRVVSDEWDLHYAVWCNGEHELHNLKTDPGQLINLLHEDEKRVQPQRTIQGFPIDKVVSRLDSLLFVLKSCKEDTCIRPWKALHPRGNVASLSDALSPRFNTFYEKEQQRVSFGRCEFGHILDAEGPQFEDSGVVFREDWSHWT